MPVTFPFDSFILETLNQIEQKQSPTHLPKENCSQTSQHVLHSQLVAVETVNLMSCKPDENLKHILVKNGCRTNSCLKQPTL